MRLAIISDIHGNAVALEAVLNALAAQHIAQILCLGDVAATGPQPCQVIERLRGMGYVQAVLWLMARIAEGLAHAHDRGILHRDLCAR